MSLLFLEGFDWLDPSISMVTAEAMMKQRYSQVYITAYGDCAIVTGRHGYGSAFRWGDSPNQYFYTQPIHPDPEGDTSKTCIVGFAVKTPTFFDDNVDILSVRRLTTTQAQLRTISTGSMTVYRGTTYAFTSTKALVPNSWYYIEFKVVVGNSPNGEIYLRVNGEDWGSITGTDTQATSTLTGWDNVGWGCSGDNSMYLDDIYVCDGQGTVNNDFLGDINVRTLKPNGDASVALTRSAGTTNYENVDSIPVTADWDDVGYVESGVSTTKDLYDYTALETEDASASIIGVSVNSIVKATAAKLVGAKNKVKSGATEASGTTRNFMWDVYNWVVDIQELDPNTSSAWTPTTINAAQFGIEVA